VLIPTKRWNAIVLRTTHGDTTITAATTTASAGTSARPRRAGSTAQTPTTAAITSSIPFTRVSAARPHRAPAISAQRSCGSLRYWSVASSTPSTSGTNRLSDRREALRTTSGGNTAAIAAATSATRLPHNRSETR
jgi:hypothetical protein